MGKSTPSAPAAPDPKETAAAQGAINKETAIAQANLNRVNQYTPQGQSIWSQTGTNTDGTPKYEQRVSYSPEQQALYNATNQAGQKTGSIANEQLDRLQSTLGSPIDYSGAPALQSSIDPNSPTYKTALDAQMARINPQIEKDRSALDQRLASQGITYGHEAYNNAQTPFNQGANDARTQASMAAFQTALQQAQLGNTARQQNIQETASARNQPLNEISALLSGSQVQAPTFSGYSQTPINPADYAGASALKYQGDLANFNSQTASNNAAKGALGGIGGSVLGAGLTPGFGSAGFLLSDRRMKRDIKRVGMWGGKYPAYFFRYLDSDIPHYGIIAQDVLEVNPSAVREINNVLHVNYGAL